MSEPDFVVPLDVEARQSIRDMVRRSAAFMEEVAALIWEADLDLDAADSAALERAVLDARAAVAMADALERRERLQ